MFRALQILGSFDLDGVRALLALNERKDNLVAFLERAEGDTDEAIRVKKEMLLYADTANKAALTLADFVNGSFQCHREGSEVVVRKTPPKGRFPSRLGDARDLDGLRTLIAFGDFELELVAFAELIELHVHKLAGVEEDILLPSFDLDEPEAAISNAGDNSLHHAAVSFGAPNNHQVQEAASRSSTDSSFSAAIDPFIISRYPRLVN